MRDFVFVLEQTLGHIAHSKNLERVVRGDPEITPTFVHLDFEKRHGWQQLPALGNWSFRASVAARRGLIRKIKLKAPDAIFIHTQVAALFAIGLMRRIPTVVSLDATPLNFDRVGNAYLHHVSHPSLEAAKLAINRRAFAGAAGLVTWCKWAADSLRDDYGVPSEKIRVIPPGVDTSIFSPGNRDGRGPVRLLFVGGDLERKGGLDLLQALGSFDGDVELDLVTGSNPPIASPGVTVRVHRGLKPQSAELVRLYREADIFVLPARGDCLPQAIAEAMASGLPVIATAVGAIPELVRDGENGLIVPAESPAELARAIAALISDPQRRAAMGAAGLEKARRDHDMARNNRSILTLMSDLAEARSFAVGLA
jgi:glycosyltransferase involved in cell wall biosynthesis